VPLAYFAVLLESVVVFARTRNFGTLLRAGRVAILLAKGGIEAWHLVGPRGITPRAETFEHSSN
jgi:hypothetical protein